MTSDIPSAVRTLVARSSYPNSVSCAYRKWGTQIHKSEKFMYISGRLSPNIVPIF